MENIGIYVHIPFCRRKCKYCDFVSFQCDNNKIEDYLECLLTEIEREADTLKDKFFNEGKTKNTSNLAESNNSKSINNIDTIYIGGGTPSIVPTHYIEKILSKIFTNFPVSKNAEITIEANPGTLNEEKLKRYRNMGINRLSIGLQSTNDNLLNMLGRIHTYKEFEDIYAMARNAGFNNINVDLMIGLPNQTMEDVEKSLKTIISKSPEHISVYSLIVEEDTKMYELIESNMLELPDETIERKMYWTVKNILETNGYIHYEISNFAKAGFGSKHNLNCWKQHSYLGFGVAAHSYFEGNRYSNINDINKYIENCRSGEFARNVILHENQSREEMMKEYMLIGLRMIEGVKISDFKGKFVDNPLYLFRHELNKLVKDGLVEISQDSIKLTNKGVDFGNVVWSEFL